MDLTEKQKRFCHEYIIDLNATQSAIRAGYSLKTAGSIGERILKNVEIQSQIKILMKDREKRTNLTADKVINEISKVCFVDIKNYLSFDNVNGITFKNSDEVDGTMISEVSSVTTTVTSGEFTTTKTTLKLKLHDKMKGLEMAGRHLKMFEQSPNQLNDMEIEALKDLAKTGMKTKM